MPLTTSRRTATVTRIIGAVTEKHANRKMLVIIAIVALLFAAPAVTLFVYRPFPPIGFVLGICLGSASIFCLLCGLFPWQLLRLNKRFQGELEKERSTNPGWWVQ
jgi:hypothetical protein